MSKQRDRDEFITLMTKEGVPVDVTRLVMRHGATLQRLAEWNCNGYGWEDHWKRIPCPNAKDATAGCDICGRWEAGAPHGETTRGAVYLIKREAQAEARITKLLVPYGVKPVFQGDPRGAMVKLKVPSGYTNDWGKEGGDACHEHLYSDSRISSSMCCSSRGRLPVPSGCVPSSRGRRMLPSGLSWGDDGLWRTSGACGMIEIALFLLALLVGIVGRD